MEYSLPVLRLHIQLQEINIKVRKQGETKTRKKQTNLLNEKEYC